MKKTVLILLSAVLLLSLCACGGEVSETPTTNAPKETTSVSRYESVGDFTQLQEHLTWETINAIPIKRADMTIDEARQLCVDFFRFAKTALWISDADLEFIKNASGSQDEMGRGVVYGGLPYVGVGSGNVYRLMDYMDPETGVVDLRNAVESEEPYDGWKTFGNQCSIGAWWGWARVINSPKYTWTQNCVVKNKMPRIGPYTYDDKLPRLGGKTDGKENPNTVKILEANGEETMYKSYAELKLGDGLVYYTTAGHVIMASSEPHVEYKADGSIDPELSYITIIDQGQTWLEDGVSEKGDTFKYKGGVDTKKTFTQLFKGNYMPFTYLEFLGEDPIEDTVCEFSYTGDTITVTDLFSSQVTSNYSISDVYAIVYDEDGNEVYKHAVRAMQASLEKLKLIREKKEGATVNPVETWGKLEFAPGEVYKVEIVVQLGTGERPTIYQGNLVMGE